MGFFCYNLKSTKGLIRRKRFELNSREKEYCIIVKTLKKSTICQNSCTLEILHIITLEFMWMILIFFLFWIWPPSLWTSPTLGNHDLNKLASTQPKDGYKQVTAFLAKLFLDQDFLYIFQCKKSNPLCSFICILPLEIKIQTNLNVNYPRMLHTSYNFSGRLKFLELDFLRFFSIYPYTEN